MPIKPITGQILAQPLNDNFSFLETEIYKNVNGSPRQVYATLADLRAAYPNGSEGVFLVTADGHLYFWDGTTWKDAGAYQSTGLADGTVTEPKYADSSVSPRALLYKGKEKFRGLVYPLTKWVPLDSMSQSFKDVLMKGILNIRIYNADPDYDYKLAYITRGQTTYGDLIRIQAIKKTDGSIEELFKIAKKTYNIVDGINNLTLPSDNGRDEVVYLSIDYNYISVGSFYDFTAYSGAYDNRIDIDRLIYKGSIIDDHRGLIVKRTGDLIEAMFKYNDTLDMIISFNRFGPNNILDIYGVQTIENTNVNVSGNFNGTRTSLTSIGGTDWTGPYKVRALENINGDNPSSSHFTGGNHGYNPDGTGSATGRTASISYSVDGGSLGDGETVKCNKLIITKVDYIQATNTKKTDGTGREVLEQKVRYIVSNGKIEVELEINALENIEIDLYYGLQMPYYTGYQGSVLYIDGYEEKDLSIVTSNTLTNSGTPTSISFPCVSAVVSKNGHNCRLNINGEKGLGRFNYLGADKPYFDTRSNKMYCNLVNGVTLSRDTGYKKNWFGLYEFYYQN